MGDLVAIVAAILIEQGWTCPPARIAAATEHVRQDERAGARWTVRGVLGLARTQVCQR